MAGEFGKVPTTDALGVLAQAVHAEVIADGFDLLREERQQMLSSNPVLVTHVENIHLLTIQRIDKFGGPDTAAAYMHGYYFGYRVIREFAQQNGLPLPRFSSMYEVNSILDALASRASEDHDSAENAFSAKFPQNTGLAKTINSFKHPAGRDGVRIIFILFSDFLNQVNRGC